MKAALTAGEYLMQPTTPIRRSAARAVCALLAFAMTFAPVTAAYGAATPLADIPIAAKITAKPNVIYTLDDSGSILKVLLGDSRRLFANHFFVQADVSFHSGYYPTIFDRTEAPKDSRHLTVVEGSKEDEEHERKMHFLQSVPFALKNIRWLLHNVTLPVAVPTLLDAFHNMLRSEKLLSLASDADNLVVRIFSFSFHRGLPKDETGNGGGFVFDGRSLPNPGREERFNTQSGKDAPVIEYLNQQESVHQFLVSVMSLVDASLSNYQQRGFKNLMLSFGCTGGQHRSVYLAEQVAKRLRGRPGIEVVVTHRELERMAAESTQVQKAAR
jgi:hypothetical protein